jgi:light-regulated signal transduction histidine kinase (bacteriophytochrome)
MILNVDDHEAARYAKTRLLMQAGYEVRDAGTGRKALALADELRPSLILLDVNLPDISGLEVCRAIRNSPQLRSTPILQISASAVTQGDRVGGLDNGADAYLIEPVEADILIATVRALLRMRNAELAVAEANQALKEANERLLRTNEELYNFAHAASHDMKEPLRTISCFAGILEKNHRGQLDAEGGIIVDNIQKGVRRMGTLIDGLLAYAQASQLGDGDWSEVDLNRAVAAAVRNLEQSIAEGGGAVKCSDLPTIRGNEASLSQLFQNLIHNGLKYHKPEEPPHVTITGTMRGPNTVEIAIKDNGIGILPEHHQSIFGPFQRLHGSAVSGFGIGLATCQRIIERHGGKIWVESAGLGKGSTFYLSLATG